MSRVATNAEVTARSWQGCPDSCGWRDHAQAASVYVCVERSPQHKQPDLGSQKRLVGAAESAAGVSAVLSALVEAWKPA